MSIAPYPKCSCGKRIVGLIQTFHHAYALHEGGVLFPDRPHRCEVGIETYIRVCERLFEAYSKDCTIEQLPRCTCGQVIKGTMKQTDGDTIKDRRFVLHPKAMTCRITPEEFDALHKEFMRTYKAGIFEAKRDLRQRQEDMHFYNAAKVTGRPIGEVTWEQRQVAKRCAFGAGSEEAALKNLEIALQIGQAMKPSK